MSLLRSLSKLRRNFVRREQLDQDLDAELQSWVDHVADQKTRTGKDSASARREALAESGGIEQVKETVRDARAGNVLESVLRDIQFGARLLIRNRAFSIAALAMLTLGIGANTAVFSVLNALVLRGLPYSDPDRIVAIYEKRTRENNLRNVVSPPDFLDWREQSNSFENMAAVANDGVIWQSDSGAEQVAAGIVSPEFFDVLGVKPAIGAGFRKEEEIRGSYDAVILTDGFWKRRFGGDPALLGRSLTINGRPREVVGILPPNFDYPVQDVEMFVPLWWRTRDNLSRSEHVLLVVARLKSASSIRSAQAEMDTIASRLERQYPQENRGHGANVIPMRDVLLGPVRLPLLAVQAATVLVLLIACSNLANLLLARTIARERELSVRLAIGAGRGRLIRQLLCESTLLALLGGVAGIALAYQAMPFLRSLVPVDLPLVGTRNLEVDGVVLAACFGLSLLCGLVFGLAPAWRGARVDIATALKEGTIGSQRSERLRKTLIAFQIAMSIVLLTATTLFLRSFHALRSVDSGLRAPGVLTMQSPIPGSRYQRPEEVIRLTSEWMDAIRRLPGVQAVGLTSHLPVSGMDSRTGLAIEGVAPSDPNQPRRAHIRRVSPGYFEALGLRIIEGRAFREADRTGASPVMIVNEAAARMYFPEGKAVGHHGHPGGMTGPWSEVVGVVANVRHWGLDVEPRPEQYYCHLQTPTWMVNLTIRAEGDPKRLAADARRALHQIDSLIPVARVQTMEEVINRSMAAERSILILLCIFAGIALLLTAAGIWGTTAYLLYQRRREMGIRLALGATETTLSRRAVVGAMPLVAAGIAAGVIVSVAIVRLTKASLFGVSSTDPITWIAAPLIVAMLAWLANYYPARLILRSTPCAVLRQE